MTRNLRIIFVVAVVLLLSLKLNQADVNAERAIEKPVQNPSALNQNKDVIIPSKRMHFSYCIMKGYHKKYEKYANALSQAYPNLIVTGSFNDLSREAVQLAIFTVAAAVVAITFILKRYSYHVFEDILTTVGMCATIILACIVFVIEILTTDAFEIYLDGELKFSKLKEGRMPEIEELFRIVDPNYIRPININISVFIYSYIIGIVIYKIIANTLEENK